MKITKGQKLKISDSRKGNYFGIATEDFDTDDEWYRIALDQETPVEGMSKIWYNGDEMPSRKGLSKIELIE